MCQLQEGFEDDLKRENVCEGCGWVRGCIAYTLAALWVCWLEDEREWGLNEDGEGGVSMPITSRTLVTLKSNLCRSRTCLSYYLLINEFTTGVLTILLLDQGYSLWNWIKAWFMWHQWWGHVTLGCTPDSHLRVVLPPSNTPTPTTGKIGFCLATVAKRKLFKEDAQWA